MPGICRQSKLDDIHAGRKMIWFRAPFSCQQKMPEPFLPEGLFSGYGLDARKHI
jgi:hypothetical protein